MIKLVCVNLQNDFIENGAFPIKGFRDVVDKIVRLISATNESRMNSSRVMLVDSFHPENHFSFLCNGGKFPSHCIQNTYGQKSCLSEYKEPGLRFYEKAIMGIDPQNEDVYELNYMNQMELFPQCVDDVKFILCGNSLDYGVINVANQIISRRGNVLVRADLCTCIGDRKKVLKLYDTLGIPYEDLGHSKKNEWTLLENDRYVFLKRMVYEEANGIGTKIIRKEFSICADVEKGRLFITPDNKKNKAGFHIPDEQYKKMRSILLNRCKKHFGFTPEYEWGETNFEKLKNYIRFPLLPQLGVFDSLLENNGEWIRKTLLDRREDNRTFDYMMAVLEVKPTQLLRKTFLKNPYSVYGWIYLMKLGFKDLNIINEVITRENFSSFLWDYDFKDYKSTADLIFAWQRSWSYEFVEVYKDIFSERKLVSLLDSAYRDDNSFDAFVMFLKIHKNVNFSEDDRKKILHEGFTEYNQRLINRIKNEIYIPMFYNSDGECREENIEFNYLEKDKELECEIDGYEFHLASGSRQLLEISHEMCNCVGHLYQEKARNRNSIIMYCSSSIRKYEACIELVPNIKEIYLLTQCYGFGNSRVGEDVRNACNKWISKNSIVVEHPF